MRGKNREKEGLREDIRGKSANAFPRYKGDERKRNLREINQNSVEARTLGEQVNRKQNAK